MVNKWKYIRKWWWWRAMRILCLGKIALATTVSPMISFVRLLKKMREPFFDLIQRQCCCNPTSMMVPWLIYFWIFIDIADRWRINRKRDTTAVIRTWSLTLQAYSDFGGRFDWQYGGSLVFLRVPGIQAWKRII